MPASKETIQVGKIEERIFLIRGEKVVIDSDLAEFYGVPTKRLNEQLKRNRDRFPVDFVFQLTAEEKSEVVANCDHLSKLKFSRSLPYAFTEHGTIMAATVLNSTRAIEVSVFIVRAFVKLRQTISLNKDISQKVTRIENRLADHDQQILSLVKALKQLIDTKPLPKKRRIGFHVEKP
jgi:hypothetical protein